MCVCVCVYVKYFNKLFLKIIIALERGKKSTNTSSLIELNLFSWHLSTYLSKMDSTLGIKSDTKCTFTEPGGIHRHYI